MMTEENNKRLIWEDIDVNCEDVVYCELQLYLLNITYWKLFINCLPYEERKRKLTEQTCSLIFNYLVGIETIYIASDTLYSRYF